jgi:two-component system LytT family sensor kinase
MRRCCGAWSALYYAINFFLQVEEQNDQLIRLENQATSAQLAMLRYQLNPHFLFNTLNSISTLVLLKQTEPANAMLSRLSSFLRYTLINEPTGRVTVAQEVETLKLYLDIERMRFEERLRTTFRIEAVRKPRCCPRCCSSLSSKTPSNMRSARRKAGAEITIAARNSSVQCFASPSLTPVPGLQSRFQQQVVRRDIRWREARFPPAWAWPTFATGWRRPMARIIV